MQSKDDDLRTRKRIVLSIQTSKTIYSLTGVKTPPQDDILGFEFGKLKWIRVLLDLRTPCERAPCQQQYQAVSCRNEKSPEIIWDHLSWSLLWAATAQQRPGGEIQVAEWRRRNERMKREMEREGVMNRNTDVVEKVSYVRGGERKKAQTVNSKSLGAK